MADYKSDQLYCIDPATGKVVRSIPSPAYWPEGLAWDGEALWNADVKGGIPLSENYAGKVYRIDPGRMEQFMNDTSTTSTQGINMGWSTFMVC
ncbi:MAG: hypothetical protein R2764_05235 [Bacteroidales bacterium]